MPPRGQRPARQVLEPLREAGHVLVQAVQHRRGMRRLQALAQGPHPLGALAHLAPRRRFQALLQPVHPQLALADEPPRIGDAGTAGVELRLPLLALRPPGAQEPRAPGGEVRHQLFLDPGEQLGGRGGCGRAHVGGEVGDGEVDLVADRADGRHRACG